MNNNLTNCYYTGGGGTAVNQMYFFLLFSPLSPQRSCTFSFPGKDESISMYLHAVSSTHFPGIWILCERKKFNQLLWLAETGGSSCTLLVRSITAAQKALGEVSKTVHARRLEVHTCFYTSWFRAFKLWFGSGIGVWCQGLNHMFFCSEL